MKKYHVALRKRAASLLICVLMSAALILSGCSSLTAGRPETGQDQAPAAEADTGEEKSENSSGGTDLSSTAGPEGQPVSVGVTAKEPVAVSAGGTAKERAPESASVGETAKERAPEAASVGETAKERAPGTNENSSGNTSEEPENKGENVNVEDLVRNHVKEMSLEDKVSGLFILTPEALTGYGGVTEAGEVTRQALRNRPVAGLIYSSPNIQSRDQVQDMLRNTSEWGGIDLADSGIHLPPFLAVDEEGGAVARVADSPVEVPYVGAMGEIGASGDPEAAYAAGDTIGSYLKELGFNLDFAPDADVLIDPYNQTIGARSFGSDPALCAQMVGRFIDGLHENEIASCVKHFPGLGDTETDTHTGGAWSSRTLEDYRGAEFLSFRGGLEAGTDLVMISHLSNQELTGSDLPASMNSTVITQILRDELGYDGVIITDALQMGAVTERADSAEAAVLALEAGADLLLMPADFETARQGVLDAVADGRLTGERIDESLVRILLARSRLRGNTE